jgi:hypothetical protein
MLGAASEHLMIRLAQAVEAADRATATVARKKIEGSALGLLSFLHDYFGKRRKSLPRALADELDTTFGGIAGLIRVTRNDAGHPTRGRPVSRDQAFVNLQLFPSYRAWVVQAVKTLPL